MNRVVKIVFQVVGVVIALGLLISAVVWGYLSTPSQEPCVDIHYSIYGESDTAYITNGELTKMLKEEDIYPVGRAVNHVSLLRLLQLRNISFQQNPNLQIRLSQ